MGSREFNVAGPGDDARLSAWGFLPFACINWRSKISTSNSDFLAKDLVVAVVFLYREYKSNHRMYE
jgi:hypothetical protein